MGSPFAMKHRRNPMAIMALQSSLAPCVCFVIFYGCAIMGRPAKQEMPSVSSLRDQASKVGRLKKLSGKGILTSGTWRQKFCLLVKNKLYYYENEDAIGTDKYCGFVNLEYFDICTEASTRMARKATNVLVIGSSDKGFFESHSGRYFAAETLPEMKEWVNAINSAMKNHIRKDKRTTRDTSLPPGQTKRDFTTKMKSKKDDSSSGTLPRSTDCLDHVTKGRVRGPQGRRLPRKPQRPNEVTADSNNTDSVLDSEDDTVVKDSRGRVTSLSSLETQETHLKTSTHNMPDEQAEHGNAEEMWDSTDIRDVDGAETPDIELIYDYSSSDSNADSGSQLSTLRSTASGSYVQRRPLSRAGSNLRNSSVTPPPCIIRKNRREQESNNNVPNSQNSKPPIPNHAQEKSVLPEFGSLHRASSGSSLSTLTADTYSDISQMNLNGGPFLSLQRNKDKKSNGSVVNGFNNGEKHFPAQHTNMKTPIFQHHQRQASSVHGSPVMSNVHMLNIQRNGCSSNNSSPNNTFGRNGYLCHGNANNGFQLERSLFSLNKDLESISQDTKQLDMDVTCLRQDIGTVQENIFTVRVAVGGAQEKMTRLQNHVNYVEKQIASIIQEAREMLDSAKNAKELQNNLVEEAQSLVAFLKHSTNYVPSTPYLHQHFNGHFGQQACCPSSPRGTPVPPYCVHSIPHQQSSPVPTPMRQRGKTPERSIAVEAPIEAQIGGHNKRASVVELSDRKLVRARSPIPDGKQLNETTKVSHL